MDVFEDRTLAGEILRAVLLGKITPLEASFEFPKDTEDPSVEAAFHALMHFEADEDLRKRDVLYAQEQDEYIEIISDLLIQGEPLPQNIIAEYREYYKDFPVKTGEDKENFIQRMLRLINM